MSKLTLRQERFVAEYLINPNATRAAIRAGYNEKYASVQGSRMLARADVAAAVKEGQDRLVGKLEGIQEMVVRELARIAFGDQRDILAWGPDGVALKDSAALTADQAAAVSEISECRTTNGRSVKVRMHDKVKALELLGKHLGLFVDRVDHSGAMDININLPEGILED